MRFVMLGRMGSMMRQVVGFGDRSTGRGNFRRDYAAQNCNPWGVRRGLFSDLLWAILLLLLLSLLLLLLSARDVIYTSRAYATMSVFVLSLIHI